MVGAYANGDIPFRNHDWSLITGTPRDMQLALSALAVELKTYSGRATRGLPPEGTLPLGVYACRSAPWRAIMEILLVSRRMPVEFQELYILTSYAESQRCDGVLAANVSSWTPPPERSTSLDLTLAVEEGGVRLGVEGRAHRFPPGRHLGPGLTEEARPAAEAWIGEANRVWAAVEEDLAAARRGARRAWIRVLGKAGRRHVPHPAYHRGIIREDGEEPAPPVPAPPVVAPIAAEEELDWAYVVTTVDLLLAQGVHEIAFPELDLTLTFGSRHVDPPPPLVLDDAPSTTEVVLVVTLAVLAALFVTYRGGRRRPAP